MNMDMRCDSGLVKTYCGDVDRYYKYIAKQYWALEPEMRGVGVVMLPYETQP